MKRGMIFIMSWLVCVQLSAKQYQTFEENGKVGMKDEEGHVVIPPSFEALGWSDGNFSIAGDVTGYRLQGLWGIINLKKEFVTKAEFESLMYSGGENIVARKKVNSIFYKSGCVNLRGEVKIPFVYDGIQVQGLRAIVFNLSNSKYRYGLVDYSNKPILPMNYKYIRPLGTLRYAVENDQGQIALFNEGGGRVTDFKIDRDSSFYKNYAIVYQDHLQGLIDRDGLIKLETKYQSIRISDEGKIVAQLPNEWTFINEKNEIKKQIFADELRVLSEKLLYFKRGDRWGVMEENLSPAIPAHYEKILEITKGKFIASVSSKYGVIDYRNESLIPFLFDSLRYSNQLLTAFIKGKGWQLIDLSGQPLSNRYYQSICPLTHEFYSIKSKDFYGLANLKGQEVVHCVFDSIAAPVDGLIAVKFKGKYGILDVNENWLVAPQSFALQAINRQVYLQRQPENDFVKTFSGEVKYFSPYQLKFNEQNFTETLPNGIEKTIGYDGVIIHRVDPPESTEEVFRESEGLRGMRKNSRYGFVDKDGKLQIANRYDSIGEFHEGLASVKLIGKWGFVDKNDHVVINPNYDNASLFFGGAAIVSRNKKFGVIDKTGNSILPLRYDSVSRQVDSYLIANSRLKGIADFKGNVTIEPRFDSIETAANNLLIVCRDGKCGVVTNQGLNIVPMIYETVIYDKARNVFITEKKSLAKEIALN